jgi:PST family polysaccharide transporter
MPEPVPISEPVAGRVSLRGRSLRSHAARGAIVNGTYVAGLQTMTFLKGLVVAGIVSTAEYGVWGILLVTLGMFVTLKQVGAADKYVQQSDGDQEAAFQRALGFELLFGSAVCLLMVASAPVLVLVYGEAELLAPALVLALYIPAASLQLPLWTYYRRMQFVRQRLIQGVEPVVALAVTIPLVVGGAGYWSLVIGVVVGAWAAALTAIALSPYPLRVRWERAALKEYASFSWPLVFGAGATMVVAQASLILGDAILGLSGVGAITLAVIIAQYTERLDFILVQTLYPAICAVQDRADAVREAFLKSNRVGLMWGVPFGVGLALFAQDLVDYGIGEKWQSAVVLLQVFGVIQALHQIGFNWDAFYRARGETRPIAVASAVTLATFAVCTVPLLVAFELDGFAAGMAAVALAGLAMRGLFIKRLFPGFQVVRYVLRAFAPVAPAALTVLALRAAGIFERSAAVAITELAVFGVISIACTIAFERKLLRELGGYIISGRSPAHA